MQNKKYKANEAGTSSRLIGIFDCMILLHWMHSSIQSFKNSKIRQCQKEKNFEQSLGEKMP